MVSGPSFDSSGSQVYAPDQAGTMDADEAGIGQTAAAVLIEAALSFLGAGTPPEVPSWGNIIAEGRLYVQIAFWNILFPSVFLALMVLSINILGDWLKDVLNPKLD